jgi:hypothetical protein
MKTFEYKRVKNLDDADLDVYGAAGWELLAVYLGQNSWYYFKRERGDEHQCGQ